MALIDSEKLIGKIEEKIENLGYGSRDSVQLHAYNVVIEIVEKMAQEQEVKRMEGIYEMPEMKQMKRLVHDFSKSADDLMNSMIEKGFKDE